MAAPKHRSSRNFLAGAVLIVVPALTVFIAQGKQKPWHTDSPAYRQKGDTNAKITIIEFSDFQCPSCAFVEEPLKQVMALYSPNVHLVFKHRPWPFHHWARNAALATECAGKQGKFWELHDLLFGNQGTWGESSDGQKLIDSYAASLHLDSAAYTKCLADPATAALIDSDTQEAKDRWVNATPTFFINGLRVIGAVHLRKEGVRQIERVLGR